jgi:hypothetical protein
MSFVVAAVVVLAVLCLGNLLVLFAVLRRLRGHEERLASADSSRMPRREELIGRRLPEFEGTSTSGEPVSQASLIGRTRLVGVFSATCKPCLEQASVFARHDDPNRVAVVVMGSAEQERRESILAALGDSPTVLTDPASSTVADRMGVRSYPSLLQLDETGTVIRAEHSLAALTTSVR